MSVSMLPERNPTPVGSGVEVGWFEIEHSGILNPGVPVISQVFFMVPEQQFGAAKPTKPIEACGWAFIISAAHLVAQSE